MMRPCSDRGIFRFLAMAILIALAVTLAVALPGVSADGDEGKITGQGHAPAIPDKTALNYPNLGSHLDQLVVSVEAGQATVQDAASNSPVHSGESVAVAIYLTGNVDAVVSFLEDNGGDPRNVGEDYIEAYVPVTLLGPVSEQPGVVRVREIVPPQPAQDVQMVAGHGPAAHLSAAWNQAGYSGQDVRVGIIDDGFKEFSGLIGTELPEPAGAMCFTDMGRFTTNLADCEGEDVSVHGTAVAEAVIDIAPQVTLYIANPYTQGDLHNIVDWMISEGVSIINVSLVWPFNGPGDGTSTFSGSALSAVDRAVDGGIIWVNAAGNEAKITWFSDSPTIYTATSSTSSVDFVAFDGADDISNGLRGDGGNVVIQLRWDDTWDGASSDVDLILWDTILGSSVARAEDYQTGLPGHIPREILSHQLVRNRLYEILVIHRSGSVPDWVQVNVFSGDVVIEHFTEEGSIGNPAESANRGMLAVGATHYWDTHTIADYSSQGPTPDGRVKPDIVGTACGEAASYEPEPPEFHDGNNCWFPGTSQAAPHVAGLAALVRQRFPDYTPTQVANYLKAFAQQRETPDPNNTWGHGFARLPSPDREALLALYNATGGANWTNNTKWLTTAPIGQWRGVTTDSQGRVTELNLTSNQLKGEIPTELADLASLKLLDLGGNELTGPIPTWLSSLTNLEELYLWENELTGTIPAELGRLSNLGQLSLSGNQLTGQIPAELGNLSNLQELYLWGNGLTGTIPSELGSLTKLQQLSLSDNQLTGTIPTWLGSLTDLQELYLWGNELSGEIPTELGSLTNLKELHLNSNRLTGEIPAELARLTKLEDLRLWGNELSGEIPANLGMLSNLEQLHLSRNQLTGEIPAELARLTKLEDLRLWGNELSGEIPANLGMLSNLEQLHLSRNQLTGEIPSELGRLSNLDRLDLGGNQLRGEIPSELGSLANLERLSLSSNQLTGQIPTELGRLSKLEELYLWGNRLSGMVPETLVGLTLLETFVFHNNPGLCAPIDDAFQTWLRGISTVLGSSCAPADSPEDRGVLVQVHSATNGANWTNNTNWLSERFTREWYGVTNDANGRVHGLFLGSNQLTGKIPSELGGLTKLEWLYLNNNQLTGEIPAELGDLANLRGLSLMDNQLTGEIPAELGRLTNLTVLRLAGNQLTGCVPDGLRGVADNDLAQLGLPFCQPYDANGDGSIDIGELFSAIDDYFAGLIGIGELFAIIDLYFLDPT